MNEIQKGVIKVLERMLEQAKQDEGDAEVFADVLEPTLDELHWNDFFGSEGQCDPRGDFRNGDWSMWNVEQD